MNKNLIPLILTSLILPGFLPAEAQGPDLRNRVLLNRARMVQDGKIKEMPKVTKAGPTLAVPVNRQLQDNKTEAVELQSATINAFVKLNDGYTASDLEEAGMTVNTVRGNIAIVTIPVDSVDAYSLLPSVKKLSIEKPLSTKMDTGRRATGIDDIHEGNTLTMPYTGKGVLGMIIDEGVDPNHIAFLDEEGVSRVKFLTYFDGSYIQGYPRAQYYGDNIVYQDDKGNVLRYPTVDKFYTDSYSTYHGTHTLNILGGGYKGDVTVYEGSGLTQVGNRYYGGAPESDLAVSCGDLSDACVAMGLAELLSYADYRREVDGMPSVVSISLGSSTGPHDPYNVMNEFLEYCGEEAIIVVSAGNEGDLKIALNKTFSGDDNSVKSLVYPYGFQYDKSEGAPSESNTFMRNGTVMIYSDDDTPFTLKGFVMTGTPGNYRRRATFDIASSDGVYYASDASYANYVGGTVNSTIGRYFEGFVGGGVAIDQNIGRYYGAFDYFLVTNPDTGINEDGSEAVIVGFEVIGENGHRVDCFCDGDNTWLYDYGLEGYADGSTDGTISDMAVGYNLLVAGAYNTREVWTALNGTSYTYGDPDTFSIGKIGPYSSYGTMADGRTLPHVCAPGTSIISAMSSPFVESYFAGYESYIPMNTTAKATAGGKDYYWTAQTGTSMSTPLVAGGIALWLEADPSLTLDDIYDIIEKTSVKDEDVAAGIPAQWGAGKFDALAGLKEVIARRGAGIKDIAGNDANDRLILQQTAPGHFSVFVGPASALDINVYSLSGSHVYSGKFSGNEASLDLSSLSKGIYVMKVNNHTSKFIMK